MRAVVQRVSQGKVKVNGETISEIGRGVVVLLGVHQEDRSEDVLYIVDKIAGLRLFEDERGKMNLSVEEVGGGILLVSQFTLYGDCKKGRRPSFTEAAPPEQAERLYQDVARLLRERGLTVKTGVFGAKMEVEIHNEGPVTLLLDSQRKL